MCLPMGCSILCHYFELFSSFLEWVVRSETGSLSIIHYLDDFLSVGPSGSGRCLFLLDTFHFLMSRFGVPLSQEKTEGPCRSWVLNWIPRKWPFVFPKISFRAWLIWLTASAALRKLPWPNFNLCWALWFLPPVLCLWVGFSPAGFFVFVFWVSTMAGLAVLPQSKIIRTFTCSRMLPVRWVLVQFLEIAGALGAGPWRWGSAGILRCWSCFP